MNRRTFLQVITAAFATPVLPEPILPKPFVLSAKTWQHIRLVVRETVTDLYVKNTEMELIASGHYPPQADSCPFILECDVRFEEEKSPRQLVELLVQMISVDRGQKGVHLHFSPSKARENETWYADNLAVQANDYRTFMGTAQSH